MRFYPFEALRLWRCVLLFALLPAPAFASVQTPGTIAPISLTGAVYTQNFDTLASTQTTANLLPGGWGFIETGNAFENTTYSIGNGTLATGDTYSFGAVGSKDRALGTLRDPKGGTAEIGAIFVNATGTLLRSLKISFTGEQWRRSGTGAADRLDFSLNQNPYGGAAFVDYNLLDFNAPNVTGIASALDGNSPVNQTVISYTITGLNIPAKQQFAIRWTDFDAAGTSESGLGVDSFSMQAVPEPSTVFACLGLLGVVGWKERRRLLAWRR